MFRSKKKSKKNTPVSEVRIGSIVASIWENKTRDGVMHNVTFGRLYKEGEEWKKAEAFGQKDLMLLARVADRANSQIDQLRKAE